LKWFRSITSTWPFTLRLDVLASLAIVSQSVSGRLISFAVCPDFNSLPLIGVRLLSLAPQCVDVSLQLGDSFCQIDKTFAQIDVVRSVYDWVGGSNLQVSAEQIYCRHKRFP
jgi:hypothetical protein